MLFIDIYPYFDNIKKSKLSSSTRVKTHCSSSTFPSCLAHRERRHKSNGQERPIDSRQIRLALIEPAVWTSRNQRLMGFPRPCHAVRLEEGKKKKKTGRPNQVHVDLTPPADGRTLMFTFEGMFCKRA